MGPDIVLVGWDDVSHFEATADVCPRLAAFRAEALEPALAFSHPVCSQSRQAVLFGCYGKKLGTWRDVGTTTVESWTPPASLPTLPQVLALGGGYVTALVGKWHCGPAIDGRSWEYGPRSRGYHQWRAGTRLNLGNDGGAGYGDWERVDVIDDVATVDAHHHAYATVAQLEAAEEWWSSHAGAPRFMHVALNEPHDPADVPPDELLAGWPRPDLGANNRQLYKAKLRACDTALGRVLDLVGPSTAVFFYSDNGTPSKYLANGSPWKGKAKETVFDGGVRVLIMARWGGAGAPHGLDSERMTHLVDVPAGVCAVAGVIPPTSWDSRTTSRNFVLSEALSNPGTPDENLERLARTRTYALRQLTLPGQAPLEQLYALVDDPFESSPLDLGALTSEGQAALDYLRGKLAAAAL